MAEKASKEKSQENKIKKYFNKVYEEVYKITLTKNTETAWSCKC